MHRTVLKILCMVSGILFAALAVILVISAMQVSKTANAAGMSIIGGADAPTAAFLLQKGMGAPAFCITIADFLLFVGTGLALLFTRKPKES